MNLTDEIRMRLADLPQVEPTIEVDPHVVTMQESAKKVMASYQNANKWLDTIKEEVLMEHGLVFFSNYIHELAHTMPERFDKFGSILHKAGMKVPYPETLAYSVPVTDCASVFYAIENILEAINKALYDFVEVASSSHKSASIATEDLMLDIDVEWYHIQKMKKVYAISQDNLKFDQWIKSYADSKESLLD